MLKSLSCKLSCFERLRHYFVASTLFIGVQLASPNTYALTLNDFTAHFTVQVASFNIGQGTHTFKCVEQNCTLKSYAKPSGFIRNFFKDELYETTELTQTDSQLLWQSYQRKDVRYKGSKVSERVKTLEKTDQAIIYTEKQQSFPLNHSAFDQMSIAYVIQWLRLNNAPRDKFNKLILQTEKGQFPINFTEFGQATTLGLAFANSTLKAEKFVLQTDKINVELWCLAEYDWFPAKIKIYNKDKDRTITLELAKAPRLEY